MSIWARPAETRVKRLTPIKAAAGGGGQVPVSSGACPMSHRDSETPPSKVLDFFRGLGELTEFLKESGLAVLEVAVGRWPQPVGDRPTVKPDETIIVPASLSELREGRIADPTASAKSTRLRGANDEG
jgi:hypothetical protein